MLESRLVRHFPQLLKHLELERDSEGDFHEGDMIRLVAKVDELGLRDEYKDRVLKITTESIYDEAAKFATLFRDRFVCLDCEAGVFYVFRNYRWQEDRGHKYLTKAVTHFNFKYAKNSFQRKQFISDIALHAYVDTFEEMLGNFKAVGLKDKVFDINSGTLRQGCPLDYTSVSTRVAPSTQYRQEVIAMLKDIFPKDNVFNYFMRYAGSLLVPGNRDKLFMVWSGTGNNGKSILARLIELTLGDYAVKLPTSLVTSKRSGSASATPELLLLDRKLVAFLQEPSPEERLNIGVVKELTGNDTVYVRGLYQGGKNIHLKAKIIYVVNSTENLAVIEEAVWNRIVVLPFDTHFTDEIKSSKDRRSDPDLMQKLRTYAGSFLGLLIEEAQLYLREGLMTSSDVLNATSNVKLSNDYIRKYRDIEGIDPTYPGFVAFMKEFYPGTPIPNADAFAKRF